MTFFIFGLLNYSILHQIKYPKLSTDWKFTDCKDKPLLLFSSLDWGLGHTTRSIPLIKELLNLGCDLIVACNSIQKQILQSEFPDLRYLELQGYGLNYGSGKWSTRCKILFQFSKILTKIKSENTWLRTFVKHNRIKAVISDNRYGLYHPGIYSVLITHQLQINSGYGSLADKISKKIIYRFIKRFSECWVPDFQINHSLAGILSHPEILPAIPVHYLGAFSRFEKCDQKPEKKFDILIIISGPEPQRTIFENIMLEQSDGLDKKIAMVRGLPGERNILKNENIKIFNHLNAHQLNQLICDSGIIICRSGYTTIMDMMKLKKKMIVIPTPGQPEQEYLATYLSQNHLAFSVSQNDFLLVRSLKLAENFTFTHLDTDMNEYKVVIKEFVAKIISLSPSPMC